MSRALTKKEEDTAGVYQRNTEETEALPQGMRVRRVSASNAQVPHITKRQRRTKRRTIHTEPESLARMARRTLLKNQTHLTRKGDKGGTAMFSCKLGKANGWSACPTRVYWMGASFLRQPENSTGRHTVSHREAWMRVGEKQTACWGKPGVVEKATGKGCGPNAREDHRLGEVVGRGIIKQGRGNTGMLCLHRFGLGRGRQPSGGVRRA